MFDYLLVGAGLHNAVFAREAAAAGKSCLVLEKRPHIGGNCRTEARDGTLVHCYGAHIFHTSNEEVWSYVNRFADFRPYIHAPVADWHGERYALPFNMNTFRALWGVRTPEEARAIIEEQSREVPGEPRNLEEQAVKLVGRDVFEKLIRGYTEKQWGRPCAALPPEIIRRLPVRFTYDNNYFDDVYQGIPAEGYTVMMERMLSGCRVLTGTDFRDDPERWRSVARRIVYTGAIDGYFGGCFGALEYRSLRFESETLPVDDWQGTAVVNYTDVETPWTRIIEHRHFSHIGQGETGCTVITREYPQPWTPGRERYYPVADASNRALYERYAALAREERNVVFAGRLGAYRYYDMDDTVAAALSLARKELL